MSMILNLPLALGPSEGAAEEVKEGLNYTHSVGSSRVMLHALNS